MKLPLQWSLRALRNAKLLNKNALNGNSIRCIYMLDNNEDSGRDKSTRITETLIQNKLKECSVSYVDGNACLYIEDCGFCHKSPKKSRSQKSTGLYVNKKTGFFLCDKCKVYGNWSVLSTFLDKYKENPGRNKSSHFLAENCEKYEKYSNVWNKDLVDKTIWLAELETAELSNIFKTFNLIPCSKAVTEQLQIKINKEKNELYIPLFTTDNTVVGHKTIDKNFKVSTHPINDCPGLLKCSKSSTTAVIVADVPDFFALTSQNLSIDVLCLPHGVSYLPQITLPFLEKYKNLIFWLGGAQTLDAAGNFTMKLGSKRCSIVKPINKQVSAVAAVTSGENIRQILESARSAWHKCIIDFNALREEVLFELQNKDQCSGITWKKFPVLNKILKGHRRGELTVLTGPTGSGKTTFMSEYSLDLAEQGVNTLWGSFEIKNSRLAKRMLQQFAGLPMEENMDQFDYWADKFEQLPIYFMTFHGQQPLNVVMDAVEHSSYVHDIAHVIIDNVQFMIEVSPDSMSMDRFWKQDILIQNFRSFASKFNCHVTLVMHPKKGMDGLDLSINSIFGGAKAAQEADNILIIQNKMSTPFNKKKVLQISKNRFSGDLGTMPLIFNKKSFSFSRPASQTETSSSDVQEPEKIEITDDWRKTVTEYEEVKEEVEEEKPSDHWKAKNEWNRLMNF